MRSGEQGQPVDQEWQEPVLRWVAGAAVGAVALLGVLIIVVLVAVALEPPGWLQTLLGAMIAFGAASLAWLVANALGGADKNEPHGPHLVHGSRHGE